MGRDASLDEFLEAGGADESTGAAVDERSSPPASETEPGGNPADDPDAGDDPGAVAPAASTYEWSPGGRECPACGATVERRWRDDGALVCVDCKEW